MNISHITHIARIGWLGYFVQLLDGFACPIEIVVKSLLNFTACIQ